MTILELCFSNSWGGLEIYVSTFAKEFSKAANNIICVTIPHSKLSSDISKNKIENLEIIPKYKYLDFISAIKIKKLLKKQIDIIHVHQSKDLSTAILLKRLLKTPKLIFSQQMDSRYRKKDLFHKWIYKNIDYVITMTDDMRNNHINNTVVNQNKIKTIYNGIDLKRFGTNIHVNKKDLIRKFNLPDNKSIIGSIGRLDSLKNQELLVDTANILVKKEHYNFHFLIVGDETNSVTGKGYRQRLINKINELSLNEYFSFFGFSEQVEKYFNVMDIFVLPTNKESFGYVLIEAMAMGKPVIASNQGGPKEIIDDGQNGYLFEPKNFVQLADILLSLIKDEEMRLRMGNQSKIMAQNKFDVNVTIDSYIKLFTSLINN